MAGSKNKPSIIKMDDIARDLHLSISTVSRAVSGKGRMKEETRKRILDYIEETGYHKSAIATGFAKMRTFNIGFTIPKNYSVIDVSFFQHCLYGLTTYASEKGYDLVTIVTEEGDLSQLKRLIERRKVDGLVIGRSDQNQQIELYLKEMGIPFLIFGLSDGKDICQIYQDHQKAGKIMTEAILNDHMKPALIGGDSENKINKDRLQGFMEAFRENGTEKIEDMNVYSDCYDKQSVKEAVSKIIKTDCDCIICMDDYICNDVFDTLSKMNIQVPQGMKVSSLYQSDYFSYHQPPISSVRFDAEKLGKMAGEILLSLLDGEKASTYLQDCELILRDSTGHPVTDI